MSKKRHQNTDSFTRRLLGLIAEPAFVQFEHILSEPNVFKIVGRSHYERWHSCFLGWLLDPNGTHLLGEHTLTRFLLLLLDSRSLKANSHSEAQLLRVLPTIQLSDVEVTPNENVSTERSVQGVGRFDVFITAKYTDYLNQTGNLNLIIELKIDTRPRADQSKKYADWLHSNHPNDVNLLVYVLPDLLNTSRETVGDERWYCLDYQLLHDRFLTPLLEYPNLNPKVRPFIIQYIKNLKTRHRGIKMAITNEEKEMALALYEKYSDVFDSIFDALVAARELDQSTTGLSDNRGRESGMLAVKIDGKVFKGDMVRTLFENILHYLVDSGLIQKLPLPWGTSNKRYIVTNEQPPVHPSERAFFIPVSYDGYTIETHYARERALKVLSDLCEKLEVSFEQIDV